MICTGVFIHKHTWVLISSERDEERNKQNIFFTEPINAKKGYKTSLRRVTIQKQMMVSTDINQKKPNNLDK